MIRVLVADDSATDRALLTAILGSDPDVQVVGEARDGVEAVELTQKLRPQLVTLDVRMPRMDGLAAAREIMITAPTPIVIVTGSSSARDQQAALDMLGTGALAVLHKPPGPGSRAFDEESRKLIGAVKAMAQVKVVRRWRSAAAGAPAVSAARAVAASAVAIATSTGGPAALHRLLGQLPAAFALPVLVVQHITPGFAPGLAHWLGSACRLRVKVAEHGEGLAPRTVYLAPDDRHLGVSGKAVVALADAPPVGGFRPSGTHLFESVARAFGPAAAALILTGMGEDGVEGLRAVRRAGGRVIAQDEKTSVVFGMPGAAAAAGLADAVLPLDAIAAQLAEWAGTPGA